MGDAMTYCGLGRLSTYINILYNNNYDVRGVAICR